MRINLLSFLVCPLLLLFSCKKYKSADPAFFIKTDQAFVSTNPLTQGSGNNKITDLSLYVDGQFQGTYPLGTLLPITTKDNNARINVFAGIKNNGIAKTRIPWQFYERFDLDTTVEAGKTINRNFTFKYNSATVFALIEGFDDAGFKMIKSPISEVPFSIAPPQESLEGKSMLMELPTTTASIAQIESAASYSLPYSTSNVYLEINYKCDAEFSAGIIGEDLIPRPVIYMNAQPTWSKIYISLATEVNQTPLSSTYKIYFRILRPDGNTGNVRLFLDNIKLIYI